LKMTKIKAAKKIPGKWAEGPTMAESYEIDPSILSRFDFKWRFKGEVIDAPAYVRGPPKVLPPHDAFLDYLEWKINKPWYERLFLP